MILSFLFSIVLNKNAVTKSYSDGATFVVC